MRGLDGGRMQRAVVIGCLELLLACVRRARNSIDDQGADGDDKEEDQRPAEVTDVELKLPPGGLGLPADAGGVVTLRLLDEREG